MGCGKDPQMAILCLRATLFDHGIPSPAKMLYNRKMRSNIPSRIPGYYASDDIHQKLLLRQKDQHRYADGLSRGLPPLGIGQQVRVQDHVTHLW